MSAKLQIWHLTHAFQHDIQKKSKGGQVFWSQSDSSTILDRAVLCVHSCHFIWPQKLFCGTDSWPVDTKNYSKPQFSFQYWPTEKQFLIRTGSKRCKQYALGGLYQPAQSKMVHFSTSMKIIKLYYIYYIIIYSDFLWIYQQKKPLQLLNTIDIIM